MNENKLNLIDPVDLSIPPGYEVAFKALIEIMERPFCALGKRKRTNPIQYENKDIKIVITSSYPWGIATIYDMDFMLWFASRITDKLNKGEKTSPVIEFTPYDCLKSLGRGTGGFNYKLFEEAINRLFHTRIITTIREEDQFLTPGITYTREKTQGFNWIVEFELTKEKTKSGKETVKGARVILANWYYLGLLRRHSVLQLANDYFELKSGLDRALYLIARKHCGRQNWWPAEMKLLYQKTGSDQRFSDFARDVRMAVKRNTLPEYVMKVEKKKKTKEEVVHFYYRNSLSPENEYWEPKRLKGRLISQ